MKIPSLEKLKKILEQKDYDKINKLTLTKILNLCELLTNKTYIHLLENNIRNDIENIDLEIIKIKIDSIINDFSTKYIKKITIKMENGDANIYVYKNHFDIYTKDKDFTLILEEIREIDQIRIGKIFSNTGNSTFIIEFKKPDEIVEKISNFFKEKNPSDYKIRLSKQ